jgi:hypothetical protein
VCPLRGHQSAVRNDKLLRKHAYCVLSVSNQHEANSKRCPPDMSDLVIIGNATAPIALAVVGACSVVSTYAGETFLAIVAAVNRMDV